MPQALLVEYDRVDEYLLAQIVTGIFLARAISVISNLARNLRASQVGRHVTAAVRRNDSEARESIQDAFVDQV